MSAAQSPRAWAEGDRPHRARAVIGRDVAFLPLSPHRPHRV